jgi:protein-S-isoprenylcysteine O-methyltransferase Ste14
MLPRRTPDLLVPALFLIGAVFTGSRAAASIAHALVHSGGRAWLSVAYAVLRTAIAAAFALFTVGRAAPRQPARSPVAFIACAVAMTTVVILGDPPADVPRGLVLTGDAVAVAFCAWLLVSVSFLGRCFGVLPEARGLVTSGPYAIVRHPVYLGEIGATTGLVIAAPTIANVVVLSALVSAQVIRVRLEEAALSSAFPAYSAYAQNVPRLLPYLRTRRARPATATNNDPASLPSTTSIRSSGFLLQETRNLVRFHQQHGIRPRRIARSAWGEVKDWGQ